MDSKSPLGAFLQARRSQVTPAAVGLARPGDRRRVPGLRREELAMLAGVSPGYYSRLEQGQSQNASAEVLNAIASALQLSPADREHLHVLSRLATRRIERTSPPPENASDDLRTLLAAMSDVPALITGRRNDILAWNAVGHALLAGHLDFTAPDRPATRPNMSRLVFLDERMRELYLDWNNKSHAVAGNLRVMTAQNPGDADLAALVGELIIESPEFARMWMEHTVRPCSRDIHDLRHPLVGELTITQQVLRIPQAANQSLIAITAEPGSSSEAALALLRQAVAPMADPSSTCSPRIRTRGSARGER